MIILFAVLQALDILSTWVGLHLGLGEASPTVRLFLGVGGPLAGLILSKSVAFGLLAALLLLRRAKTLRWVNIWYAVLVAWNFTLIGLKVL